MTALNVRAEHVRSSHQELCEAGGRHREADPSAQPERGRPLPAAQPRRQAKEKTLLEEDQVRLHGVLPEGHPGRGEGDHGR